MAASVRQEGNLGYYGNERSWGGSSRKAEPRPIQLSIYSRLEGSNKRIKFRSTDETYAIFLSTVNSFMVMTAGQPCTLTTCMRAISIL